MCLPIVTRGVILVQSPHTESVLINNPHRSILWTTSDNSLESVPLQAGEISRVRVENLDLAIKKEVISDLHFVSAQRLPCLNHWHNPSLVRHRLRNIYEWTVVLETI